MPSAAPVESSAAAARRPVPRWQQELAAAIRDVAELAASLQLDPGLLAATAGVDGGFPLLVPRPFVDRMRRGDPADPLLLQVLPRVEEATPADGFVADPLGEAESLAAAGLVRKYAGRVLVLLAAGCAVNCRYCFRREFPYVESGVGRHGLDEAIAAVAADASVSEVILSGGDPLLVDDQRLAALLARLQGIPHLRRLRIHTRLPIVLPSRVTQELVDMLATSRLTPVVVVHANHPAELDDDVAAGMRRLSAAGVLVFNQAVLLAGINDAVPVLAALCERLVDVGVVPYYLHLLDRVRGAAHFDVAQERAVALHRELLDSLPGYAVPRLVREIPGERSKVPVF
jgi:EF-P beta-lysylation protein EpmB